MKKDEIRIDIPEGAGQVLSVLHGAGYQAWVVGGCVRDAVLGRTPADWDITTDARPEQVKELFPHTFDTGIQHGTVTVLVNHTGYEVTTYRIDGVYADHRHPESVTFAADLRDDVMRRDFTINAMAYNNEDGLQDYFGGRQDLKQGIIRAVGDPEKRFEEDALRVLRALRFAGQLGFTIEEKTLRAMKDRSGDLKNVSAERIRDELTKLLVSDHPRLLMTLGVDTGIVDVVLPEYRKMLETTQENPYHCYNVGGHCMVAAEHVRPDPVLRWTALLHDIGKTVTKTMDENGIAHFYGHGKAGVDLAASVLRRLKFDNDTVRRVKLLVRYHDFNWGPDPAKSTVRRVMNRVGPENFDDLLEIVRGDVMGKSELGREPQLTGLEKIRRYADEIRRDHEAVTLHDLKIDGKVLMEMGIPRGPLYGRILNELMERVIDCPEDNDEGRLRSMAAEIYRDSQKI